MYGILLKLGLATLLLVGACVTGAPRGPHIRVATATPSQLEDAEKADTVWYEFKPGDLVPVFFGFLGAVEGGTKEPAVLRAKKRFFFVTSKNQPIRLSFDGKTFANKNSNQSVIAVLPRSDGKGGHLVWMMYMGAEGNPEAAMDALVKSEPAK